MQCATVPPTAHTVSLLLCTLAAAGQAGHALWLLRDALRAQYDLGPAGFSAVLQLLAVRGDWAAALGVCRAMALLKLKPDAATAGLLVTAALQAGSHPLAAQLLGEMQRQGLLPPPPRAPPPVPLPLPMNGNSHPAAVSDGSPASNHYPRNGTTLSSSSGSLNGIGANLGTKAASKSNSSVQDGSASPAES
jgi:hypothetical protein